MKKNLLSLVVILSAFCVKAQYNMENLSIEQEAIGDNAINSTNYSVKHTFKNLRLYPILANETFLNEHKDLSKFTLLKEAIEQKKIIVSETGASDSNAEPVPQPNRVTENRIDIPDTSRQEVVQQRLINVQNVSNRAGGVGGTVNKLVLENVSQDTIFILAGEVVKGGKQDRVIGQDVVILPGQKMDISAFCVEKSRWQTKNGNGGKFTGYYTVSSMDIRKTVTVDKSQQKVWSKVDEHTTTNKAESETKTYTNLENSEEYKQKVAEYRAFFENSFVQNNRVIGVIAVTGDEIMGCDMFANHELFAQSYSNLLQSYIGQAVTKGSDVTISNDKVYEYLSHLLSTEENQEERINEKGSQYKFKGKKVHISTF